MSNDRIATDCEGSKVGYRCYGEEGFERAITKVVTEGIDNVMRQYIHLSQEEAEVLRMIVKKEARQAEMWEKVKSQVLGWGIIAIVGWLGLATLKMLENWRGQP